MTDPAIQDPPIEDPAPTAGPTWAADIQDADLKGAVSKFETQQSMLDAIGFKPPAPEEVNWRDNITNPNAKKFAEDSTDINHLVTRAMSMREQLGHAVVKPGKDASEEQINSYRKSMGIPDSLDGYDFPHLSKEDLTDEISQNRKEWAERFHALNVPNETAIALMKAVNEDSQKQAAAEEKSDKDFIQIQESKLHSEWQGADYEKNTTLANRAFKTLADRSGLSLDELTGIQTKDGRFLMDRAEMVKIFATVGREMSEGTIGPAITESEVDTAEDQIRDLRSQIEKAQTEGNSKLANQLYVKQLELRTKIEGARDIVGSRGRVA